MGLYISPWLRTVTYFCSGFTVPIDS
jgi:hypothetical protein